MVNTVEIKIGINKELAATFVFISFFILIYYIRVLGNG